jgi:septum formation topological specificity factor MinE
VRTNYVLIDFENVQPQSLDHLAGEHFKVFVFVGASQKLTVDFAASLQRLGPRAEYIQISGNGSNALDFHIAYYMGQLAAADAAASFHIVSKDSGFDPLIKHLRSKGVFARRVKSITDISRVEASHAKSPAERLQAILARLRQFKAGKPRSLKTLRNTIGAVFQKQLTEEEIDALVQELVTQGYLSVSDTKVIYPLPGDS